MQSSEKNSPPQDDVNFSELGQALWQGRWLIAGITFFFALAAGTAGFLVTKKYDASVLISPVSDSLGGQISGSDLTSQFGGLASLAGISSPNNSKKSEAIATLKSEVVTEAYIKANDLLPVLYSEKWDAANKRWRVTDPDSIPTLWKANRYFDRSIRTVTTDTKSGLVTLKITWKDPQAAAQWANDLVRMSNEYLRKKALDQSDRNIAYLKEQAAQTDAVGIKQAIYTLLQTEINKAMLARGSADYALKVIDPAVTPELASFPQKKIWVLVAVFIGLVLSSVTVLFRASQKKGRPG